MWWIAMVAGIIGLVITADQVSKALVLAHLYKDSVDVIPGVLRFTYVENYGGPLGLFPDSAWVLLLISIGGVGLMLFYLWRYAKTPLSRIGLSLIISGGIGNMIDRISLGFVVDFIDFCAFPKLWAWVFNIADAAVCVGAALFILDLIIEVVRELKRESKAKKAGDGVEKAETTSHPEEMKNG